MMNNLAIHSPSPSHLSHQSHFSRRRACLAAVLFSTAMLSGCAGPTLQSYADQKPMFDLQTYFTGDLIAHGMVSDRSGEVLRRFVVTMKGTWEGARGTLDEQFIFDDGERQQRIWKLQKLDNGRYTGTADDVVGQAQGQQAGSAFRWQYTLKLPVRGEVYEVQFDDWMHLIDANTVINKAEMSKFGVRVGDVTLSFTKR